MINVGCRLKVTFFFGVVVFCSESSGSGGGVMLFQFFKRGLDVGEGHARLLFIDRKVV